MCFDFIGISNNINYSNVYFVESPLLNNPDNKFEDKSEILDYYIYHISENINDNNIFVSWSLGSLIADNIITILNKNKSLINCHIKIDPYININKKDLYDDFNYESIAHDVKDFIEKHNIKNFDDYDYEKYLGGMYLFNKTISKPTGDIKINFPPQEIIFSTYENFTGHAEAENIYVIDNVMHESIVNDHRVREKIKNIIDILICDYSKDNYNDF